MDLGIDPAGRGRGDKHNTAVSNISTGMYNIQQQELEAAAAAEPKQKGRHIYLPVGKHKGSAGEKSRQNFSQTSTSRTAATEVFRNTLWPLSSCQAGGVRGAPINGERQA